jgi:hypothetical protein
MSRTATRLPVKGATSSVPDADGSGDSSSNGDQPGGRSASSSSNDGEGEEGAQADEQLTVFSYLTAVRELANLCRATKGEITIKVATTMQQAVLAPEFGTNHHEWSYDRLTRATAAAREVIKRECDGRIDIVALMRDHDKLFRYRSATSSRSTLPRGRRRSRKEYQRAVYHL